MDNQLIELEKPYTLRHLQASEFFPTLTILRKIGFKNFTRLLQSEDVKKVLTNIKNGETEKIAEDEMLGLGSIIFEVVDIVIGGLENCEEDIYKILSAVSGLSIADIKEFDIEVFTEMIIDLVKANVDFIKAVSKYLK